MKKHDADILIVDDEEHFRTILSSIMEEEGFKVLEAPDGETALRMLRVNSPDIMLTDVKMPGMDGWELLKKAKDLDPDLPVVMITAFADIPGAVGAVKEGAHDYLPKPFDNYEVIRVVRRALAERDLKRKMSELSSRLQENLPLREVMGPSDAKGSDISSCPFPLSLSKII